jgi:transposase
MARIKSIALTAEQRTELEAAHRSGESAAFRRRGQIILLQSQSGTSLEVAGIVGCCEMSINNWVARYQEQGLAGLHTRPGRGRKAIWDAQTDLEQIKAVVRGNRQRVRLAKAELEEVLGKISCDKTLVRSLKNTLLAINASKSVPARSRSRTSTR